MKLYLTEQQEQRLKTLARNETLAQQATQLYVQGVFDAAGVEPKEESTTLGRDDEGAYLLLEAALEADDAPGTE